MRRLPLVLTVAAVLVTAGVVVVSSSAATSRGSKSTARSARLVGLPQLESQVLAGMNDLRRKSLTTLSLEKLQYNLPLKEGDFTIQALRN